MAEKFRKIVNAPHKKLFARAAKKLRGDPERTVRNAADGMMSGAAGLLFWLTSKMTMDNAALRAMEKKLAKKVKNPNLVAHLTWYMMLASIVGGYKAYDNRDEIKHKAKQTLVDIKAKRAMAEFDKSDTDAPQFELEDDTTDVADWTPEPNTFGAYNERLRPLTPLLIAELLAFEGVVMRDGMHVVYDDATGLPLKPGQRAKGTPTIGFGSTVMPDGSPVTSFTRPITTEQAYEIARWHIEKKETSFLLYCYDIGNNKADVKNTQEAFALMSVIYNSGTGTLEDKSDRNHKIRNGALRALYDDYGYSVSDSMVREVFEKYPVKKPYSFGRSWLIDGDKDAMANNLGNFLVGGRGLYVRRMVEAAILTGKVNPVKLLDVPVNGLYEFLEYMGGKKGDFWKKDKKGNMQLKPGVIAEFNNWLKNPTTRHGKPMAGGKWIKIRDVLPADIVRECESGNCRLGAKTISKKKVAKWREVNNSTYVINDVAAHEKALSLYKEGKYAEAAAEFEKMLTHNKDNALIHNDLAATYNKLGRYDDAIAQARIVIYGIRDKSQYGAAQYNAGYAYEKKGNLQKALLNYKLAVGNGNLRVKRHVVRIEMMLENQRNKKGNFNKATKNVKNKKTAKLDTLAKYMDKNGSHRA